MKMLRIPNIGRGGASEKIAGHLINDNESAPPDSSTFPLQNCHTNEIGEIVKRKGYTVYTGPFVISGSPAITLTNICGLYEYRLHSGSKYSVACASDGTHQKIVNYSTPSSIVDITGSVSFTDATTFRFATVADTLVMSTEARDTIIKWTGTGSCAVLGGSPVAGKYVIEFYNYLFIGNTSSNPERAYWSAVYDPETWGGTDFKRMNGEVMGFGKQGNNLFIFTRNSITVARYTGDSSNPFTFDVLDTGAGCISQDSIVNIEGVLYWLSGDGYSYRMTGFKPERVTEAIPNTLSLMNVGGFDIACAVDHKELRQVWFCVTYGSSTINDFTIAIDYLANSIFLYKGMNVRCVANFTDSNGDIKTYFGDNTGRIYLTNNGNADYPSGTKTEIDYWRYTKQFDLDNGALVKHLRRLKATANNEGNYETLIDVSGDFGNTGGDSVSISHNGGGDLLGSTWVLGSSSLGRVDSLSSFSDLSVNAKYFQFKFHNKGYDQPSKIRDFEAYYNDLGVGRG